MSLWAIGDLHLSFSDPSKSMDVFGENWINHEEKIKEYFQVIYPEDTLVLVGDHSWGKNIESCKLDFDFITKLPGKKILTRGNHDMFWDAKRTNRLNEMFAGQLQFLQADFIPYEDYALVATKGYTFEGRDYEKSQKLVEREAQRLKIGLEKAKQAGYTKIIIFLHYPPTNIFEKESIFTRLAEEYHAEKLIYAHCHGKERFHDSLLGMHQGIQYQLVSGDYLDFHPYQIL